MSKAIDTIFHHHRRRYGYRRIWKPLAAEGITCAPDRVRRLMQEWGLIAIQPKTYVSQTSDDRADLPSPNLLLDQPLPTQPNEVWAGDICFATLTLRAASLLPVQKLFIDRGWRGHSKALSRRRL